MEDIQQKKDPQQKDQNLDRKLRPQLLDDFTGQCATVEQLKIYIGASLKRNEALGHTLFYGPPGLGKTTLANIMAREMGKRIIVSCATAISSISDICDYIMQLKEGDILFIDEIHRLKTKIAEHIYPTMEDFEIDIISKYHTIHSKRPPFTLIGATTHMGKLSAPFRSRFGFNCSLELYPEKFLVEILARSTIVLQIQASEEALSEIAKRSRGTPRIANNLLKWTRDYAQMRSNAKIDTQTASKAMQTIGIDSRGLDKTDRKMLRCIINTYRGGPIGLKAVASTISEELVTLEESTEPYLLYNGFIKRTPRGREVTKLAYEHLKDLKYENENHL